MSRLRTQASQRHGPALVAVGLTVLILAARWPAAPLTTAMALVALGATNATLAQFPHSSTVVLLHTIVYAMLYTLFFGATCHTMATQTGPDTWRVLDLVVSLWPMALATRLSLGGRGTGTFCSDDSAK